MRTISHPACSSATAWRMFPAASEAITLSMDCTVTGASEPIMTFPARTCLVFLLMFDSRPYQIEYIVEKQNNHQYKQNCKPGRRDPALILGIDGLAADPLND